MNIVIVNRWNDQFSRYSNYVDHVTHNVVYISTRDNLANLVTSAAKKIVLVDDITDFADLVEAVNESISVLGNVDRLIALSEFDLINAAKLRKHFNIQGNFPEQVAKFRDKVVMKQTILAAGLKAPVYAELHTYEDATAFAQQHGFPLIIKPRNGAASIGVLKIDSAQALLDARESINLEDAQIEQYIEGTIYHVDGIADNAGVAFSKASQYVNTCFGFSQGMPLGSYVLPDNLFTQQLEKFSEDCLSALGIFNSAFHLEVICHEGEFYFLEVGARVGGGEIPFTMAEVYNVDLYQHWIFLLLNGGRSSLRDREKETFSSGFVLFPEPIGKKLINVDNEFTPPALYASIFPAQGHFFDGQGGYDTILARFRFRASDAALVEQSVRATIDTFTYEVA